MEDLLVKIDNEKTNTGENQKEVERRKVELDKKMIEIEALAADAQAEVEKVEPALKEA